jgi:hypothetical protein
VADGTGVVVVAAGAGSAAPGVGSNAANATFTTVPAGKPAYAATSSIENALVCTGTFMPDEDVDCSSGPRR